LWSSIRQNNKKGYDVKIILRHESANLLHPFAACLYGPKYSLRYKGLLGFTLLTPQSKPFG
jgi:hypothetical protein